MWAQYIPYEASKTGSLSWPATDREWSSTKKLMAQIAQRSTAPVRQVPYHGLLQTESEAQQKRLMAQIAQRSTAPVRQDKIFHDLKAQCSNCYFSLQLLVSFPRLNRRKLDAGPSIWNNKGYGGHINPIFWSMGRLGMFSSKLFHSSIVGTGLGKGELAYSEYWLTSFTTQCWFFQHNFHFENWSSYN